MSYSEILQAALNGIKGVDERLKGVADRHDVYPAIDPQPAFSAKSFAGKVVLVTGASRGIGLSVSTYYARAGAALALVARTASYLEEAAQKIRDETKAEVLTFAMDVKETQAAADVVQAIIDKFGRIDVVVANAGVSLAPDGTPTGDRCLAMWWNTMEVNLLGTLNFVGPALKHLKKTNGYVVVMSSISANLRHLGASEYGISKLALNRFVEFISLEYADSVTSFAVHPGAVWTDLPKNLEQPEEVFIDKPELAAATILALTSGKYDWLSGRFIDSTLDLGEVVEKKEQILSKDALVTKLVVF